MMRPDEWDAYHVATEHLAVARWGRWWRAVDRETGAEIGPPFPTMAATWAYAEYRQGATYGPPPDARYIVREWRSWAEHDAGKPPTVTYTATRGEAMAVREASDCPIVSVLALPAVPA